MKILVTGANGQVGWELARGGSQPDISVIALKRTDLDITDAAAVQHALSEHVPDILVNAAAYTAVDRAEEEKESAFAVNRDGPAHLASACGRAGIPLIHLSTDYVFDGQSRVPYSEDDPVAPLGVYGLTKWEGEEAVCGTLDRHIILRVSWVFGMHGQNFVKTMLRLGRKRTELRVVDDQTGRPTPARDIARCVIEICRQTAYGRNEAWGTYHYQGRETVTWYQFAQVIFEMASSLAGYSSPKLIPISTRDYPTPAQRPANSILCCDKIEKVFGIRPVSWREGLEKIIQNLAGGKAA